MYTINERQIPENKALLLSVIVYTGKMEWNFECKNSIKEKTLCVHNNRLTFNKRWSKYNVT